MYPGMVEDAEACLREAGNMISKWHWMADARVQIWYGLRSLGAVTPKLVKDVVGLAKLHKTKITMHLGEVVDDVRYVKANGYQNLTAFAKDMGLLGPQTVFAHGIHFEEPEVDLLAETKSNISHCPSSNMKLASGFAKIPLMLRKGVPVSLGCDGGPSNNTYDMIREMRMAASIHKAVSRDPVTPTAEQVIEMATLGGARAMGIERDVGSIVPDKLADVIVISQENVGLNPVVNPVSNLVYAGTGRDVETVIVNGKVLMENRQLTTLDEQSVIEKANAHVDSLLKRTNVMIRPKWPVR
jgi:cytosine/adenosine deaminase-related metal-dependent hydrolase